jgi:hypothetical protein
MACRRGRRRRHYQRCVRLHLTERLVQIGEVLGAVAGDRSRPVERAVIGSTYPTAVASG